MKGLWRETCLVLLSANQLLTPAAHHGSPSWDLILGPHHGAQVLQQFQGRFWTERWSSEHQKTQYLSPVTTPIPIHTHPYMSLSIHPSLCQSCLMIHTSAQACYHGYIHLNFTSLSCTPAFYGFPYQSMGDSTVKSLPTLPYVRSVGKATEQLVKQSWASTTTN